jgi:hypothetical protein
MTKSKLQKWHQEALEYRDLGMLGANSLVCSLGACMGKWPRVRRRTIARLRALMETFRAEFKRIEWEDQV